MVFDWTINLGHLLTIVMFAATVIASYYAVKVDLKGMSKDIGFLGGRMVNVENSLKELTQVTIEMAETNQRMKAMDDRLIEQGKRINSIDELGTRNLHAVLMDLIEKTKER